MEIVGGEIVLLGMLALPQMLRLGYDRKLAIVVVCAGGSLGAAVPPSIVLGMFLDWVGIALPIMPIFVPIVASPGYSPIWFGVVFAMNMQVSFLTRPFGPAAFYLRRVASKGITLGEIFRSMTPSIAMQVLAVGLRVAFPAITGQ